jgi:hypothetical protein
MIKIYENVGKSDLEKPKIKIRETLGKFRLQARNFVDIKM